MEDWADALSDSMSEDWSHMSDFSTVVMVEAGGTVSRAWLVGGEFVKETRSRLCRCCRGC